MRSKFANTVRVRRNDMLRQSGSHYLLFNSMLLFHKSVLFIRIYNVDKRPIVTLIIWDLAACMNIWILEWRDLPTDSLIKCSFCLLQDLQVQVRDLFNQYNDLTELHQQEVWYIALWTLTLSVVVQTWIGANLGLKWIILSSHACS